jgi:CRISPR/Cas system CMR subunit Cmr6 (Cas7 group RAMP superfamily)
MMLKMFLAFFLGHSHKFILYGVDLISIHFSFYLYGLCIDMDSWINPKPIVFLYIWNNLGGD